MISCSYQHWAIKEVAHVKRTDESKIETLEQAIQTKAIKLDAKTEYQNELTADDPFIKIDNVPSPFKIFTFNPGDKDSIIIKITTLETEKELIRGLFSGTHETGIFLPSVFLLDSKGNVLADSLSDLHLEENSFFDALQFEATLNAGLAQQSDYYMLVTSQADMAGSELNSTPWSMTFIKEILDEDETERLISLTGGFEINISYK
jgi:hypothetical protein